MEDNNVECRHIEVTASVRPMSYLTDVPKNIRKATGRPPKSPMQRTDDELKIGIMEWIDKKFNLERKVDLRQRLYPGNWSFELVVHKVLHPEEIDLFREAGIKVYFLQDIVNELKKKEMIIACASGSSLVDLVLLNPEED